MFPAGKNSYSLIFINPWISYRPYSPPASTKGKKRDSLHAVYSSASSPVPTTAGSNFDLALTFLVATIRAPPSTIQKGNATNAKPFHLSSRPHTCTNDFIDIPHADGSTC